jgi:hypothetical protein
MAAKHRILAPLFAIALAAVGSSTLLAKNFPQSLLVVDPLAAAWEPGIPAGLGGSFEYGNYIFSHDDVDSFYLRSSISPVIAKVDESFALGGLYETDLLCGPVAAGETAANIAAFWMNAFQFAYGLYSAYRLPGPLGLDLLAEYSRSSQHPLRPAYSQVAADILMCGLALPRLESDRMSASAYLRAGYRDLFGFWQSSLPKPRISWVIEPAAEVHYSLSRSLSLVARANPELFIDRYKNCFDANFFAEAGIALAKGELDDEFLFTLYSTRDSDLLLLYVAHPTFEAGLSVRLSAFRLSPRPHERL